MIFKEKPSDFKAKFEVVSCFLECNGEILLLHRQDRRPEGNTWGVPAGKVEEGEALFGAITRELAEEVAHRVGKEAELRYFGKVYVRFSTKDFVYHMFHLPFADKPAIKLDPKEHKSFKWVTPQKALEMDLIEDEDSCIKLFYNIA